MAEGTVHLSINTDGAVFGFLSPLSGPITANATILNNWVKHDLSEAQLGQYLDFQIKYFDFFICENHRKQYIKSIKDKISFVRPQCCSNYVRQSNELIKVEQAGDLMSVMKKNMQVSFCKLSQQVKFKSSGIPNPDLSRFIQMADGDAETIDNLRQIQSFESHGP